MSGDVRGGRAEAPVAVVGAGVLGLCTAFALLERGVEVVVYERAAPGGGQSAGASRIFRHLHGDPRLVELAVSSRRVYRAWEEALGVPLLVADGELTLAQSVADALERLRAAGVRARAVDAEEAVARLPLLGGCPSAALLDEDAGAVRARALIEALRAQVGDRLRRDEVLALRPTGDGAVEAVSATGRSVHRHAVVCAGRESPRLARGLGLTLPVRAGLQVRLTFDVRRPRRRRLACLQDDSGAFGETGAYGVPVPGEDRYAVGLTETVAVREDGSVVDPAALVRLEDRIRVYAARALPGLAPEPVGRRVCWTTALAWSDSAVAVWEVEGAAVVAGHHLFKHAPALGRALAGVAAGDGLPDLLRPAAALGAPG